MHPPVFISPKVESRERKKERERHGMDFQLARGNKTETGTFLHAFQFYNGRGIDSKEIVVCTMVWSEFLAIVAESSVIRFFARWITKTVIIKIWKKETRIRRQEWRWCIIINVVNCFFLTLELPKRFFHFWLLRDVRQTIFSTKNDITCIKWYLRYTDRLEVVLVINILVVAIIDN